MLRTTGTGYFQTRAVLERQYQQIYTYLVAAEAFWKPPRTAAPGRTGPAARADDAAARFRREWHRALPRGTPVPGFIVDLRAAATRSHIDENGQGWIGKGRDFDLRALPAGRRRSGGILFEVVDPAKNQGRSIILLRGAREELRGLPPRVRIAVGQRAAVLAFLHATPFAAPRFGEEIGAYTVRYGDGAQETILLLYKRTIGSWLEKTGSNHAEMPS